MSYQLLILIAATGRVQVSRILHRWFVNAGHVVSDTLHGVFSPAVPFRCGIPLATVHADVLRFVKKMLLLRIFCANCHLL